MYIPKPKLYLVVISTVIISVFTKIVRVMIVRSLVRNTRITVYFGLAASNAVPCSGAVSVLVVIFSPHVI